MSYRFAYKTYRLPLPAPLRTAHGPWSERVGLIVRLENEQGQAGFGEVAPIPWFGTETVEEAEIFLQKFGQIVDDETLNLVPDKLGCVRFGLWQARAQPASATTASKVRLPVAALLPAGRAALPILPAKLEAGFLAFKWKVGVGAVADELSLLDDLLAQLPGHATLRLDANGAWSRRDATRWLTRCADRPIEFVEQPVSPDQADTLRGLAEDFPVKLALDESVVRLAEARQWQAEGWNGVFVVKPALAGPLNETLDWMDATKADVVFSSAIETALGRSVILQAALARPASKRALGFGVGELFGDRRWDGPMLGPLADASCFALDPGEELWNALN